jgi:hypothetical protein
VPRLGLPDCRVARARTRTARCRPNQRRGSGGDRGARVPENAEAAWADCDGGIVCPDSCEGGSYARPWHRRCCIHREQRGRSRCPLVVSARSVASFAERFGDGSPARSVAVDLAIGGLGRSKCCGALLCVVAPDVGTPPTSIAGWRSRGESPASCAMFRLAIWAVPGTSPHLGDARSGDGITVGTLVTAIRNMRD